MRKIVFTIFPVIVMLLVVGCSTPKTTILAPGETAKPTSDINLDDVDYAVATAVQSLLKYDRIKLLPGNARAITVVPSTRIDTTRRGTGADALADEITVRLQAELTNSGKILVYDPEAAQYAANPPNVQYILPSILHSRNVTQDNGLVQIEYSLNLKLIDKATGTQFWQKSIPIRKVTTRRRAL